MERPERLNLQSADGVQLNLDALYQIAPSCFTEATDPKTGKTKRMVDFNTLRQLLGDDAVEDAPEAYEFNWVGKQAARAEVLRPTKKTLRPVKEDSVDWDNTQNLYIEGDNLEVLKLLQKSYLGKVKMIYIDPPYNTGNDFVYHDDFAQTQAEYDEASGAVDEMGMRFYRNTDSNGRFHSDWCSMIYSRLMVAHSLLAEDGVIFISIGEEELSNLSTITSEIFGESNYISTVTRIVKTASNMGNFFSPSVDYIVCFAKDINKTKSFKGDVDESLYKKIETVGSRIGERYRDDVAFFQSGLKHGGSRYPIICPDGERVNTPDNKPWRASEETFLNWKNNGMIIFKKTNTSPLINENTGEKAHWNIYTKSYLKDRQDKGTQPRNFLADFINRKGADLIKTYGIPFDFAKPIELIKFIAKIINDKECLILDFFSGSATTAHAVMQLNAEDGGSRKFIMVQLPEKTAEDSEAYKAGYKTICEIGKERIRRAGKKIKEEHPEAKDLDTGFRVFRLDEGNFEDVELSPKDLEQTQLEMFLNNIKSDRTDLDLLFGCMLNWGVQLSLPMTSEVVDGKTIYTVNDGDLVACFEENVTEGVVKAMADKMPLRVIFRDSCFKQDADKINIYETFKQLLDWSDQEVVKNIRVI